MCWSWDGSLEMSLAEGGRRELVSLEDIEMIHKKKRHDKEARSA